MPYAALECYEAMRNATKPSRTRPVRHGLAWHGLAWPGVAWSRMAWRGFAWFRLVLHRFRMVWQHAERDGREGDARLGRLAEAPARLIVHAVSAEVPAWVTVSTRVPAWATVPRESALSFGLAAAACSPSRIWLDYAPASPSRLEHFEHRPPLAVLDRVHCPYSGTPPPARGRRP